MPDPSPWPADAAERRSVSALAAHPKNARTHSARQISQVAAAIREFGWTNPILIDEEGVIIAGHGRVLAARELGIEEVPVIVAKGWSEDQKRAYLIADNQIAINAGWDADLLKIELADLQGAGVDLELVGFGQEELAAIGFGRSGESGGSGGTAGALFDKFGLGPFSIFNARDGWWQDRKAAWLSLGIKSEIGRQQNLLRYSETIRNPGRKRAAAADGGSDKPAA